MSFVDWRIHLLQSVDPMCLSLLKLRMSASRGRKVIATFQICSHPGRGHAFPVPSCFQLEPCEAEERDEREKAAGEFLKRVGSKLAFNPEELVAMTLDIDIPLPGALHGSCCVRFRSSSGAIMHLAQRHPHADLSGTSSPSAAACAKHAEHFGTQCR